MSKSYGNDIQMTESPESIRKKIMPMMTDPARMRRSDPGDPEKCPVFDFHKTFTSEEDKAWVVEGCTSAGIGCVDCKKKLLEYLLPVIEPLYEKRIQLEKDPDYVKDVLVEGSREARVVAQATMEEVRAAMNLDY